MQDDDDGLGPADQLFYAIGELERAVNQARRLLPEADRKKAEARLIRLLAKLMAERP